MNIYRGRKQYELQYEKKKELQARMSTPDEK